MISDFLTAVALATAVAVIVPVDAQPTGPHSARLYIESKVIGAASLSDCDRVARDVAIETDALGFPMLVRCTPDILR